MARASFCSSGYSFSVSLRVSKEKATGFSVPPGITGKSTHPTPHAEVSAAKRKSWSGS